MGRALESLVVFSLALTVLGWHVGAAGMGTSFVDPLAKVSAQDEAVYGSTSFEMARQGDWVTPRFLGRYALHKPPVIYWVSALSVKALGRNTTALRLPSVIAGAVTISVIFWWFRTSISLSAGLLASLLLVSNHLFFVIDRTGLTDALLTLEIVSAMAALGRDPRLETRSATVTFGLATGLAVMTKAVAGTLPLLVLGIYNVISPDKVRWRRIAYVLALAGAVCLPWHLWQLATHSRWFWAEYVLTEHFAKGVGVPTQTTVESQVGYYFRRLLFLDPILCAGFAVIAYRLRSRLFAAWIIVGLASVMAFHYRNTSYHCRPAIV